MTEDIEREVADLKTRAEDMAAAQQKLAAQAEAAEADYTRLLARLREEFGVSTVEEAEGLLARLDTELASEIESVRSALDAASSGENSPPPQQNSA